MPYGCKRVFSARPARDVSEWSASSMMTSTTSSMVMRPSSLPSASTTVPRSNRFAQNDARLRLRNFRIDRLLVGNHHFLTETAGSETKTVLIGSKPTNRSLRLTTISLSIGGSSECRLRYLRTTSSVRSARMVMVSVLINPPALSSEAENSLQSLTVLLVHDRQNALGHVTGQLVENVGAVIVELLDNFSQHFWCTVSERSAPQLVEQFINN